MMIEIKETLRGVGVIRGRRTWLKKGFRDGFIRLCHEFTHGAEGGEFMGCKLGVIWRKVCRKQVWVATADAGDTG